MDTQKPTSLNSEEIVLGKGKNVRRIVVSEANYYQGMKRGQLLHLFRLFPHPDELVQAGRVNLYASLAACSTGDVPKIIPTVGQVGEVDEMAYLSEADVNAWLDAARRMNPEWFAWMEMAEQAVSEAQAIVVEKEKKSDGRRRHKK